MHVTAIVAAAGTGRRVGADLPKQFLHLGGQTLLERSVAAFATHPAVQEVIVVLPPAELDRASQVMDERRSVRVVAGGPRRQDSVANAFRSLSDGTDIVLVHDAARPFVTAEMITQSIAVAARYGAAIVAQPVSDTVKRVVVDDREGRRVIETLPRDSIYLAQTPQAFRRNVLADAVALGESGVEATDEASLAERAGHAVHIVEGSAGNMKITTAGDLEAAQLRWNRRTEPRTTTRVGAGYDLHTLVEGRRLMLGGIEVPSPKGAHGHSDGDVVCHAATDAVLGAACLGDIGGHFPDTDPSWKNAASLQFLRHAAALARASGFLVTNLDVVVVLERPKIAPFLLAIRESLAAALQIEVDRVSVKGKTNEGVDAVGRGEAIAAHAVALLTVN